MNITDKQVQKWIDKLSDYTLEESIRTLPEEEREGRSDIQIFADELSYELSKYHEDGWEQKEDLEEARRILRETENGKANPIDFETFRLKYTKLEILQAKEEVRRERSLAYRLKKLNEMGIYGAWY